MSSTLVTQISSKDVGKLIGRNGATINDLRSKSGCRIDFPNERQKGIVMDVNLSGPSLASVEKCRDLIDELLGYSNNAKAEEEKVDDGPIDWDAIKLECEEAQRVLFLLYLINFLLITIIIIIFLNLLDYYVFEL